MNKYQLQEQKKWRQVVDLLRDYQRQVAENKAWLEDVHDDLVVQVTSVEIEQLEQIVEALRHTASLMRKHCVA